MPAILIRIIPFIIEYGSSAIGLLSGLSLRQIGYIIAVIALLGSYAYVYDLGGDNRQYEIERKAAQDANTKAKKKQAINNSAISDDIVIDRMLGDKF